MSVPSGKARFVPDELDGRTEIINDDIMLESVSKEFSFPRLSRNNGK